MKKINIPMLLLALLVIALFSGVGIALAYKNMWAIIILFLLGFAVMGYGISLKKKVNH
ncbi:MAG TPA: DUF5325 family protein [Candidatus Dormibacteraeota bacterium]|nr:DUF5325 family protein [Candidatus Dormibacteraeota bacterium]